MSSRDAHETPVDASVIVVTHNNEALIADCLRTIEAGFRTRTHETIVIDNGSADQTLAAIPDDLAPSRIFSLDQNVGFAEATNLGIQASGGRLIVLVNSDAFPDAGSIDSLVEAIDSLPRAGIVGARLRYPTGKLQPSMGTFPTLLGGLWVALFLHRLPITSRVGLGVNVHPALYAKRRRVDWVTAAFCVARREVGPLPLGAFMYGEDVRWAVACRERGLEVWFEPTATGVHLGRASADSSRETGFAQRQRAEFELEWFSSRGRAAQMSARGVLLVHALLRMALYGALSAAGRRRDGRVGEYAVLFRAALDGGSGRAC
jgi:GT2 family glycosyltransferase